MEVRIEKTNFDFIDKEAYAERCSEALDEIWKSQWINDSIGRHDVVKAGELQPIAEMIAGECATAVFVATGDEAQSIKAAAAAIHGTPGRPEVIVFGDSLSPEDYAGLIERLNGEKFALIGVSEGLESLQFKAAFTCLRQILTDKFGAQKATDRLFAVAGRRSRYLAGNAEESGYRLIQWEDGMRPSCAMSGAAVLLALAVKGIDTSEYLDGFRDMLSASEWDANAPDYAVVRAAVGSSGGSERILTWQKQLTSAAKWCESVVSEKMDCRALLMPGDENGLRRGGLKTLIAVEDDEEDIMMPSFPGCDEDGLLSGLIKREADRVFGDTWPSEGAVRISLKEMNPYNLGQFAGFLQLSGEITRYLLKN